MLQFVGWFKFITTQIYVDDLQLWEPPAPGPGSPLPPWPAPVYRMEETRAGAPQTTEVERWTTLWRATPCCSRASRTIVARRESRAWCPNLAWGRRRPTGCAGTGGGQRAKLDWLVVEEITRLDTALWADLACVGLNADVKFLLLGDFRQLPAGCHQPPLEHSQLIRDLAGGHRHELTENTRHLQLREVAGRRRRAPRWRAVRVAQRLQRPQALREALRQPLRQQAVRLHLSALATTQCSKPSAASWGR